MIYALTVFCAGATCIALSDPAAPYADREACAAAHALRRPATVAVIAPQLAPVLGGRVRVHELCGPLDAIRQVSPDAYPDHRMEVDT
jgi:hypothetical protein